MNDYIVISNLCLSNTTLCIINGEIKICCSIVIDIILKVFIDLGYRTNTIPIQ